jgi:hypothetical protein
VLLEVKVLNVRKVMLPQQSFRYGFTGHAEPPAGKSCRFGSLWVLCAFKPGDSPFVTPFLRKMTEFEFELVCRVDALLDQERVHRVHCGPKALLSR